MENMSQTLRDQIANGEDFANSALKKVFGYEPFVDPASAKSTADTVKHKVQDVFRAADFANDGKRHLLLACSGSVATIKLPNMLKALSVHGTSLSVRVILTSCASRFLAGQAEEQPTLESLRSVACVDGIYHDEDEWSPSWTRGAPILHIELRRWADALVVAPMSANTLAKMANGLCDNLLSSIVRAWDFDGAVAFGEKVSAGQATEGEGKADGFNAEGPSDNRKMILVAPAMNTAMWRHPITAKHIKVLEDDWPWVQVLRPIEKNLACGDVGSGAMREWSEIVRKTEELLRLPSKPNA